MNNLEDEIGTATQIRNPRHAQQLLTAETLSEIRALHRTMTDFMERYQGRTLNNVLHVETFTFGTDLDGTHGYVTRAWHAPAGCVVVNNLSAANSVWVSPSPAQGQFPTTGVGVYQVAKGTVRTVPLGSTALTIYGTTADQISFVVCSLAAMPTMGA